MHLAVSPTRLERRPRQPADPVLSGHQLASISMSSYLLPSLVTDYLDVKLTRHRCDAAPGRFPAAAQARHRGNDWQSIYHCDITLVDMKLTPR
jgi:hypothetical protein